MALVMCMNRELPKRKHPRLDAFDYSTPGAYFITICTQNRRCMLSHIVGRGLAPAEVTYTQCGEIAAQELCALEKRYPCLRVDKFVVMPNHIHAILILEEKTAGASPRPTIMDIVCTYKSLVTRKCKGLYPHDKLFQTSFYEHVIRNGEDYLDIAKYILENPLQWELDKLYSAE